MYLVGIFLLLPPPFPSPFLLSTPPPLLLLSLTTLHKQKCCEHWLVIFHLGISHLGTGSLYYRKRRKDRQSTTVKGDTDVTQKVHA